jgi:hypothetical protein
LLIEWIDLENPKNIAERIKKVTGSQDDRSFFDMNIGDRTLSRKPV